MPFLTSLLSCCSNSSSKRFPKNPEDTTFNVRVHTRAGQLPKLESPEAPDHVAFAEFSYLNPPPNYHDVADYQAATYSGDVKDPNIYVTEEATHDEHIRRCENRAQSPAPSISDGSSVISIPSTRLSGLTSIRTGATTRTRQTRDGRNGATERSSVFSDSRRTSVFEESPPPSYYAESEVEVEAEGERHPVMADGWLQRLRLNAQNDLDHEIRTRGV